MSFRIQKSFLAAVLLSSLALSVVANGTQFITGPCASDADCANDCCGFNSGKCAGAIVAQSRDGGCGHGDPTPNNRAAVALVGPSAPQPGGGSAPPAAPAAAAPAAAAPAAAGGDAPGFQNPDGAGKKDGKQFITGLCDSDADCASSCCGRNTGKCAGAVIAQTRDGGCGHGDPEPNNTAAVAILGANAPQPGGGSAPPAAAAAAAPAAAPASSGGDSPGFQNPDGAGKKDAKQFITGLCTSDADCASGCCSFRPGKCAGAVIAQTRDGGCGHGDPTPNNRAAVALLGPNAPTPVPA